MVSPIRALILAAVVFVAPFAAMASGSNVNSLPPSPAIVGTQLVYCPIGAISDYKCTFNQIATFIGSNAIPNVPSGSSYLYNSLPIANAQTALNNYFFGGAGNLTMTGTGNTAVGDGALYNNTTGTDNTAVGNGAAYNNTTGSYNTSAGEESLVNNTLGAYSSAFGFGAMLSNTTGYTNAAFGSLALHNNTIGAGLVAVGYNALLSNIDQYYQTAVGDAALEFSTGAGNTALGAYSGVGFIGESTDAQSTVDTEMVFIGGGAGRDPAVPTATPLTNGIAIGYEAKVGASNTVVFGNSSITKNVLFGSLVVGGLAGSGSRPVCVTSAGTLEAGSLSVGLTTCP